VSEGATRGYLRSALADDEASFNHAIAWFDHHVVALSATVHQIPLTELGDWTLAPHPRRLVHRSGRFFTIEGYRLGLSGLPGTQPREFDQPMVNQSEVGILGFLTKIVDGVRCFLTQVKMEPGNVHLVQLAPTVQATHSNYTRVHGGSRTSYLEYFTKPGRARVLVDELQSEQGAYFLGKRNRNVVVETDEDVDTPDRFRWLPLAHFKRFLRRPYVVNMDARSVLSCLPLADGTELSDVVRGVDRDVTGASTFGWALVRSTDPAAPAELTDGDLTSWWNDITRQAQVSRVRRPLDQLQGWVLGDDSLRPAAGDSPFSVIGIAVEGGSREVPHWTQPMLSRTGTGLLGLLFQERRETLHVLVQVGLEAGAVPAAQVMPTVVCHHDCAAQDHDHAFVEWFQDDDAPHVRFAAAQSEEGGRFWRFSYLYRIAEAPREAAFRIPAAFQWMTLAQLARFRSMGRLSVETRNLLACLDPAADY
jgi:dTDP-4-dehydro-6-deoxy-alpha-D-glucopyranose 2,3-dehydratase